MQTARSFADFSKENEELMMENKRRKLVLIGAGSAVFTKGLIADFIQARMGSWEIALCDINETILEAVARLAQKMVEQKGADILITASTDRCELLPGADYVVTTIAVGGRAAWEADVTVPRRYGIYQPVGDSVMAGGISRAQRMIPVMLDIARDVERLCPEAYFFNYSNPMTAITTAVRRHTGVKMIGLCHGVIYGEKYLARMLGVDVERITVLGAGLNHLTFLYDIRVDGQDAKPELRRIVCEQRREAEKHGHELRFFNSQLDDQELPHFMDNPLSWELFERYGAIPAVMDRHAVEFFPERYPHGAYFGHTLGVDAFPIAEVLQRGETTYRNMIAQGETEGEVEAALFRRVTGEHEELTEIIGSLEKDQRKCFSMNIPNASALPGLPDDAVLELPGIATGKGFSTMQIHDFPDVLRGIIARKLAPVEAAVEAAVRGDEGLWAEAMLLDGSVSDPEVARAIVRDMREVHRGFLPTYER